LWGYSDDEMANWLGLGTTVDTRAVMSRRMAERILRRLSVPAPATPNTAELNQRLQQAESQLNNECDRVARTESIRRLFAKGVSVADTAIALRLSERTIQRIANQEDLTPTGTRESRAS
jgi:DNA-binding NarL/FixJ family response regulator